MDFPRLSYDLLVQLNQEIEVPQFPSTINGVSAMDEAALRRGIWFAAQRALLDTLIDQYLEEFADDDPDRDALQSPRRFGRVLPSDLKIREVTVGDAGEVDEGPLVPLHHLPGGEG